MTNVPNDLREMWADIYRLFDINYKMPNTDKAWQTLCEQSVALYIKYKKYQRHVADLATVVSNIINDRIKDEELDEERKALAARGKPHTLEDMELF